jgi:hypothetical protein
MFVRVSLYVASGSLLLYVYIYMPSSAPTSWSMVQQIVTGITPSAFVADVYSRQALHSGKSAGRLIQVLKHLLDIFGGLPIALNASCTFLARFAPTGHRSSHGGTMRPMLLDGYPSSFTRG